jgi:hypothetical protein
MKKKYDAVATVGKYTDKQGQEKKRYLTVGAVFEDDQGRMSLKLDGMPCSPDWSGWISFYEPKAYEGTAPRPAPAPAPERAKPYNPEPADRDMDDDIPF